MGCLVLLTSPFVPWLVTPLQGRIRGYSFPLFETIALSDGLTNPLRPFSFGALTLLLGVGVGLAVWYRAPRRVILFLSVISLAVAIYFIGHLLFLHSEILESAAAQMKAANNIKNFSVQYLNGNSRGIGVDKVTTDTLLDRIALGFSLVDLPHLSIGWHLTILSGLLLQLSLFQKEAWRPWFLHTVWIATGLLVLMAGLASRSLLAEHYRLQGDSFLAQGAFPKAIEQYELARGWDPHLDANPHFHYTLGAAYYHLKRLDQAEVHLYLGEYHSIRGNLPEAIHEYQQALSLKPDLDLARRSLGAVHVALGLSHFSKDLVYPAISQWQDALRHDPHQIQVHFFLAKAYFDISRRDQSPAIRENALALSLIRDQLVRSDVYNNLGDCYYRQTDFVRAREMYGRSLKEYHLVKKVINFNAYRGLQGL